MPSDFDYLRPKEIARMRKGGAMKKTNAAWVPVYQCTRCGAEIEVCEPRYNDYGMSQFPKVDAVHSIAHMCKAGVVGLACLAGLNKTANAAHDGRRKETP